MKYMRNTFSPVSERESDDNSKTPNFAQQENKKKQTGWTGSNRIDKKTNRINRIIRMLFYL